MTIAEFPFKNINLHFPLENILWIVLVLAILIFGVISAALIYHWRKYGMGSRKFFLVESVYLGVAILIIGMAIVSIIFT